MFLTTILFKLKLLKLDKAHIYEVQNHKLNAPEPDSHSPTHAD